MKRILIWVISILLIVAGYHVIDSFLFDGIKPRIINENGIQANYYSLENTDKKATIILIGGGQWGDYWGQQFAKSGFIGLSLPYTGLKGLPDLPEEIDLEYFKTAIKWLQKQPEVNPDKIIVMGASRNAELSLLIASTFPKLVHGVIAYSPSSVSWSNTVLPYNSNELKPSWKYQGVDIPYIAMEKPQGGESNVIKTLEYWKSGLARTEDAARATIKVENINGPILLFSGKDDRVWPSSLMADQIETRLREYEFEHSIENVKYKNAGHMISGNPESKSSPRTGSIYINQKEYDYEYGGTNEGDYTAKQDAKVRVLKFINNL